MDSVLIFFVIIYSYWKVEIKNVLFIPEFFFSLLYFGSQRPDFWIPESLTLGEMTATVGEAKIATGAVTKKTHLRTCINPLCRH